MQKKFHTIFLFLYLVITIYLFILATFVATPARHGIPGFAAALPVGLAISAAILLSRGFRKLHINEKTFFIILSILVLFPRIFWIIAVDTLPTSDFKLIRDYALQAAAGNYSAFDPTYAVFPFKFGYPLLVSLLYRVFGTELVVLKLFHVILAAFSSFLIYGIAERIFHKSAARAASILYSIWPAQIMFTPVIATEHAFLLLLLASGYFFILLIENRSVKRTYLFSFAAGITIALAQLIRPNAVIFLPILLLYLFVFAFPKDPGKSPIPAPAPASKLRICSGTGLLKVKISAILLISFVTAFLALGVSAARLTGIPVYKSSSGFSLLIGTNPASDGLYNKKDAAIIGEFHYDFERIHKESTRRAIDRILRYPYGFIKLMEKKYIVQWGSDDYGFYWSTRETGGTGGIEEFLVNNSKPVNRISQIYYLFILSASILGGVICLRKKAGYPVLIFVFFFLGIFAVHTFVEVQSRYHYCAMMTWTVLAGLGIGDFPSGSIKKARAGSF